MHLVVGLFWEASFQRNYSILVQKLLQQGTQIGVYVGLGRRYELPIFTLGSTWLPKWCPMAPKVAPRVPKGCQNEAKMPPKVFKMWVQN